MPDRLWRRDAAKTYSRIRFGSAIGSSVFASNSSLRRKPKDDFPGIVDIMSRSMVVTSAGIVKRSLSQADVLLVPPIPEGMKILDWHLGKELAQTACEFTTQRIAEHPPLQDMKA